MEATLFINTLTKVARAAATGIDVPKVNARQRAQLRLTFKFFETDEEPALLSGATFRLVLKATPSGEPFAFASEVTETLADGYVFNFVSLDSASLRTALSDSTTAFWGEIEWTIGTEIERVAFPVTITAAYLDTDEEAPDPLAEASALWLEARAPIWHPAITGLTGGGATKLDGLTTAGKANLLVILHISSELQDWLLLTGTDAEDSANGIVRPDDYATTTNEQIWVRRR